ncbi:hypothetical protein V1512DRAFT_253524 [Lipomyces arxii]|uniref:uncharacterized protein n=1 Tax=Lipomyces arxii TaxID=56418 RepID=UPI0034CFF47D
MPKEMKSRPLTLSFAKYVWSLPIDDVSKDTPLLDRNSSSTCPLFIWTSVSAVTDTNNPWSEPNCTAAFTSCKSKEVTARENQIFIADLIALEPVEELPSLTSGALDNDSKIQKQYSFDTSETYITVDTLYKSGIFSRSDTSLEFFSDSELSFSVIMTAHPNSSSGVKENQGKDGKLLSTVSKKEKRKDEQYGASAQLGKASSQNFPESYKTAAGNECVLFVPNLRKINK